MHDRQVMRTRGFTLVELLVVIAITAILLGLLLVPLVQGFRYTRQGQAQAQAQDTVRLAMNQIQNDLKRAAYVFDTAGRELYFYVEDANGNPQRFTLEGAIIDLVPPAYGDPGQPSNDPTSDIPFGVNELAVPIAPGRVVVRYFIGTMDNTSPYFNPEERRNVLATAKENLAVLYRAEFPLYVRAGNQWRLNPELFDRPEDFYDPNFFYGPKRDGWRKVAKPIVPLGIVDMVQVTYDNNGNPVSVQPLFQLKPGQVVNQMGAPVGTESLDSESPNHPPVRVRFPHGLWQMTPGEFRLVVFRSRPDALQNNQPLEYFYVDLDTQTPGVPVRPPYWGLYWYWFDGNRVIQRKVASISEINYRILYQEPPANPPTPTPPPDLDDPQQVALSFMIDTESGTLNFAMPYWLAYPREGLIYSTGDFYTPFNDPGPPYAATINSRFNAEYRAALQDGTQNNVKRAISLMDTNNNGRIDDTAIYGPLNLLDCAIVPGSEIVIGPDQRPGPNYGRPIRYQRVSSATSPVGPNQYRILYQDVVPLRQLIATYGEAEITQNFYKYAPLLRGYIEFYSDPQMPLPPGQNNVIVTFAYQNNLPTDSYVADYQTRRLMELAVGVRFYGADRAVNITQKTQMELPNIVRARAQ